MTTNFGRFTKQPRERKRYQIDYSAALNTGDVLASTATPEVEPEGLTIDTVTVDALNNLVAFYASGGTDGEEYKVTFLTTTTPLGEVLEDSVVFNVEDL